MRGRYNYQDEGRYRGRRRYEQDYAPYGRGYDWRDREDERGFFDRAGDEVRSWFGDEEAERRRRMDERRYERENYGRDRFYNRGPRYDRDDYRYGRENYYGRERGYGDRDYRDRGFFERAGDEVRSWVGDENAERRRQMDERRYGRDHGDNYGRGGYDYDRGYGQEDYTTEQTRPRAFTYTEIWMIPGPETGRGPRGYQRSDVRITEDVSERLTQHGRINANDIEVSVSDGNVTLKGTVESREVKRMAEDVAESVSGVKDVNNQLRVKQEGREFAGQTEAKKIAATGGPAAQGEQRTTATTTTESAKAKSA